MNKDIIDFYDNEKIRIEKENQQLKKQLEENKNEMIKYKHIFYKIKNIMNEDDSADNTYIHLRDYLVEKSIEVKEFYDPMQTTTN